MKSISIILCLSFSVSAYAIPEEGRRVCDQLTTETASALSASSAYFKSLKGGTNLPGYHMGSIKIVDRVMNKMIYDYVNTSTMSIPEVRALGYSYCLATWSLEGY